MCDVESVTEARRTDEQWELQRLRAELERERMRLAACGTAALGYFNGCADEYRSASLDDVLRLCAENEALRKALSDLRNLLISADQAVAAEMPPEWETAIRQADAAMREGGWE